MLIVSVSICLTSCEPGRLCAYPLGAQGGPGSPVRLAAQPIICALSNDCTLPSCPPPHFDESRTTVWPVKVSKSSEVGLTSAVQSPRQLQEVVPALS